MRKYLYLSAAALAFASCSSDEFVGNDPGTEVKNTGATIAFGSEALNATRAELKGSLAAEKLNNNFIVYGFKYYNTEPTAAADVANVTKQQTVFDRYNVNYTEGTANTTESNTANWEYVGLANHGGNVADQTIKYWDYAADGYIFSAVSGLGITATKTIAGSTVYDKGWKVSIPAGGDISTLYASDRKVVLKNNGSGSDYQKQVDLTFRSLVTKIRFAMYETVPGYEIHIDKFYYNSSSWTNTETNFAINGTFKTVNPAASTDLTITYYDNASGIENRPKVSYSEDGDGKALSANYGVFGANMQATEAIGTSSVTATYDQSDKSYTMILPYESSALATPVTNDLKLYVDYTLTSTDGSGETIVVKHASATVPTNFNQWKPNFAYTYIFKISDNTNGTTGDPNDPNDPTSTPTDPEKLFPITFDAVVITDETDVQETITSVSDPSITTYQKGVVVTKNDEYVAGDIYFENDAMDVSNYKVYEVKNFGTEATTEEVVANYLNNFCVLTEVETKDAYTVNGGIPLNNGTVIAKTADQAHFFNAEAGKIYVICDEDTPTKHYKVVKVAGSAAAVTYTVTVTPAGAIDAVDGTATVTVQQGTVGVLGAVPCFAVTSTNGNKGIKIVDGANAGEYTVSVDAAAIAAGKANDSYTVAFNGQSVTIDVNIAYVLRNSADDADVTAVTITAGNTTGATVINKIAGSAADGDVTEVSEGITVEKTATGTYKVTADGNLAYGAYTAKIAGQTLTINVDSYKFLSDLVITKALTGTSTGTLTLQKNGDATGVAVALNGVNTTIATVGTPTDGVYTFTAVAGGSFNVTYENAEATVTVNAYTMTAAPVAPATVIKKSTGIAEIEVKCNGETINAATASLVETAKPADAVYNVSTNGKTIKFSNASIAGDYQFNYKVDADGDGTLDTVVAQVTVTVE